MFLKYLDIAVGKIAPLDPMANKSVPASSKANLKTYQGRLVRRNSTNGASDEEAPKTKVSKLPTRATKCKVIDSSSEEPTSSDADRALKTRTHKEVEPPPRRTIKHFAVMGASRNEAYEALNVVPFWTGLEQGLESLGLIHGLIPEGKFRARAPWGPLSHAMKSPSGPQGPHLKTHS
ncbi:hypothetical protein BS47DRAFT_1358601 [Hydnum rufescens UP504]|uniref:Uncharacterized protein n=1 Tax=Hydnum rufescens UP504 TaxID=1448309 RepID=A0A9P6DY05_9AGAM|nr:hypothetical protein BS47DRAFT_1358601 [Hydnum rufescens UP504]